MNSDASRFLARLESEPALLESLRASAPKNRAELTAATISLAAREGVTLTSADIEAHLKALNNTSEELTDAQLAAVSGGYAAFMNTTPPW